MNKLYAWFPLSSNVLSGHLKSLITSLVIYLIACAIMGVLRIFLGWIPVVGWLLRALFGLLGLYCAAGMILSVLKYFQR